MVLVSNEWQNNKDEVQKPNTTAAPATTTGAAAAAAAASTIATVPALVVNNGTAVVSGSTDQDLTARPGAGVHFTGELAKRQQRVNKKNRNKMEINRKVDQDQTLLREKHETETCEQLSENLNIHNNININSNINNSNNSNSNDANDNLENQENNNTTTPIVSEILDSNTNTLQGQLAHQQVQAQMTVNSVLNANNTVAAATTTMSNNLFGSLSALQMSSETGMVTAATSMQDRMGPTEAKIVLQCEGKSHKFETRTISLAPNQECKVGRLIAKSKASEGNAIFDCKVLSRNHAMLWYTADGRFWVKDTKSSNGTFINDNKLGNDPAELHYGDTVKFGVEVIENSRQEVHGCIIARVTLFLPDGREAISIDTEQLQLTGPNRISYDDIQRLNAFLQEASQREKMLKAKLSNLQGVLDSTRKNSTMCWQSMITEDQLLHKISLLEKKLQMMEKNVPENALRNEIVKLLEDKSTYQLTAKEALRKVYQDRCDAMQMLTKMEMAYTTSDNECGILRGQIVSSKQTLQEFSTRLEQLQQEYADFKQDSLRQQQEAKELEDQRLAQLKEQLVAQEQEMEQMRQQMMRLQHSKAEQDSDQVLQQQQALEQLNAAIEEDDDEDDDDDDEHEDENEEEKVDKAAENDNEPENETQTTPSKQEKSSKKSKRQLKEEFNLKNKVVRKDAMLKWLKNSDLNKGAEGGDVLKAIFNNDDADSGDEDQVGAGTDEQHNPEKDEDALASDEFIHKSPKHSKGLLNGIDEPTSEDSSHELKSQPTLVERSGSNDEFDELQQDHALDMLQEECHFYKQKSEALSKNISELEEQMKILKQQLKPEMFQKSSEEDKNAKEEETFKEMDVDPQMASWQAELSDVKGEELEEELIVYKERLAQSEITNFQLISELSDLRLKQPTVDHQRLLRHILPVGCVALAAIIYFLTSRF